MTKEEKAIILLSKHIDTSNYKYGAELEEALTIIANAIRQQVERPTGIEYYAIENTIDEYGHTEITGKYETFLQAKEDLKNKYDYFRDRGTGKIVKIKQWFDGFEFKENKRVVYERNY